MPKRMPARAATLPSRQQARRLWSKALCIANIRPKYKLFSVVACIAEMRGTDAEIELQLRRNTSALVPSFFDHLACTGTGTALFSVVSCGNNTLGFKNSLVAALSLGRVKQRPAPSTLSP